MAAAELVAERPGSPQEAADLLRRLGETGEAVRVRGGGTKLTWGAEGEPVAVELATSGLDRILEHNEGDLTAVLEAGIPFARAQAAFAEVGQTLALDPPLGTGEAATLGGVLAANDSGPLRHRYGSMRDLVVGVTVALSDGTLAKAGGKVIKNVAGYDLAKLFTGSLGTLGLVTSLAVRLHPLPTATATARGTATDPERLAAATRALAALPLEADCLDVGWEGGAGEVLVRFSGAAAERQADGVLDRLREAGLAAVAAEGEDAALWAAQRARQRCADGAVLKVAARPTDLPGLARAVDAAEGRLVGRGALGVYWVALEGGELAARVEAVRAAVAPRPAVLLDAPAELRRAVDPWGPIEPGVLALTRRVKERFDPARICRPGAFVGGT